jgi:glycosyltransferase involved in cell wall biosynthesis
VKRFYQPIGRALKYGVLKEVAERQVATGRGGEGAPQAGAPRAAFLIGCGRSGTTVVGEMFSDHPEVLYFFEPYHLWGTIDPSIDVLNLYHLGASRFLLDGHHCTAEARRRFHHLFLEPARRASASLVLEKTPFNACRIGFLEELKPDSHYIHLARDGVDVARSIGRLSHDRSYSIAGRNQLNRWWGRGGCKWTALAEDGIAAGYFADEVPLLKSYESMGAYEWIVSMKEIDRWRERLGDRLLEMNYEKVTEDPTACITTLCRFLSLTMPRPWMERSIPKIGRVRHNTGEPLILPPQLCAEFNRLQERWGFVGRATEGVPLSIKMQVAMISNEPTPYRLHVLNRMTTELEGVKFHNVFTHTISNPSMPWQMKIDSNLNPVFFANHHLVPGHHLSPRNFSLFRDICQYIIENDIRMVILLGYNDLTRLMLIRWAKRRGIPLLLCGDSNVFAEGRHGPITRFIKRRYLRWVLKRLSGLMPMGTCGRAFFRLYLDHNLPEFLFPYEPDYDALRWPNHNTVNAFCAKYQLAPDRKRLLYCGRLVQVKRVDVLIEAFVRIAVARPDWDLVIAGDGPLRVALEKLIPEALADRVKWLGFLQFDETALAYHGCDILVHPSEFEPWSLVINEALACNLPIVATSVVGAAVELVRHQENGLIVPPRNVEAMSDALWDITIGDRHLQMRGRCARILEIWRRGADPVNGVRQALRHFGLLWRSTGIGGLPDGSAFEPVSVTEAPDAKIAPQSR